MDCHSTCHGSQFKLFPSELKYRWNCTKWDLSSPLGHHGETPPYKYSCRSMFMSLLHLQTWPSHSVLFPGYSKCNFNRAWKGSCDAGDSKRLQPAPCHPFVSLWGTHCSPGQCGAAKLFQPRQITKLFRFPLGPQEEEWRKVPLSSTVVLPTAQKILAWEIIGDCI